MGNTWSVFWQDMKCGVILSPQYLRGKEGCGITNGTGYLTPTLPVSITLALSNKMLDDPFKCPE